MGEQYLDGLIIYEKGKKQIEEAVVRLCFRVANDSYTPDSPGKASGVQYFSQTYANGTIKGVEYNHNHNRDYVPRKKQQESKYL